MLQKTGIVFWNNCAFQNYSLICVCVHACVVTCVTVAVSSCRPEADAGCLPVLLFETRSRLTEPRTHSFGYNG